MKNKLIKRMQIYLAITTFVIAAGVFAIVFGLSYNATMSDFREKSFGVRDYVLDSLTYIDFININHSGELGDRARYEAQKKLNLLLDIGNFTRLYIAVIDEHGEIITSLDDYVPVGALYRGLKASWSEGVAVTGNWIYRTELGRVYPVFWPVLDINSYPIAAIVMEFNVDSTYQSLRRMVIYSLSLSLAFIAIISILSYLSMIKVSEPFYRKLATRDFLTGLHNRLAYEQRLASCEPLLSGNIDITIIIFDVNNLKRVNDTLGHKQGDVYIANTAKIISEHVSGLGDTYRIGGDEFAAIIVGKKQHEIEKLLDNLRKERRPVLGKHSFSCAFGAATYQPNVDIGLNALAKRADDEMYIEKARQKQNYSHSQMVPVHDLLQTSTGCL